MSQHLAKLERELGTTLFDRAGGRLVPNADGDELLVLGEAMLDLVERCGQIGGVPRGPVPVTIAAFASAVTALVVPALAALDDVLVTIRGADDDEALRALRLGTADVALVQRYDGATFERDVRLTYRDLARDRLRLVLPPDRPATTRLADLGGTPWLLNGDGTQCSTAVRRLLAVAGVTPDVRGSIDDNRALLALVAGGHGACIVPELVLDEAGRGGVRVATERLAARRTIVAVTRRSGAAAHRRVVDVLAGRAG